MAFWMANSSELLNFLRQDRHLAKETEDTQEELAQTVQMAFKYLVHALEENLLHQFRVTILIFNLGLQGVSITPEPCVAITLESCVAITPITRGKIVRE